MPSETTDGKISCYKTPLKKCIQLYQRILWYNWSPRKCKIFIPIYDMEFIISNIGKNNISDIKKDLFVCYGWEDAGNNINNYIKLYELSDANFIYFAKYTYFIDYIGTMQNTYIITMSSVQRELSDIIETINSPILKFQNKNMIYVWKITR